METPPLFWVYILQSEQDDSFYVGYTSDLQRRIAQHNSGETRYTATKKPWNLVHTESYPDKSQAIKREIYIKRRASRKYILGLIGGSVG